MRLEPSPLSPGIFASRKRSNRGSAMGGCRPGGSPSWNACIRGCSIAWLVHNVANVAARVQISTPALLEAPAPLSPLPDAGSAKPKKEAPASRGPVRARSTSSSFQQQRPIFGARSASPEQQSAPQQFSVIRHLLSWVVTVISAAAVLDAARGARARQPCADASDPAAQRRRAAREDGARPCRGGRAGAGAGVVEGKGLDHFLSPQGTYASAPGARR